jgi:hypothetical protein
MKCNSMNGGRTLRFSGVALSIMRTNRIVEMPMPRKVTA